MDLPQCCIYTDHEDLHKQVHVIYLTIDTYLTAFELDFSTNDEKINIMVSLAAFIVNNSDPHQTNLTKTNRLRVYEKNRTDYTLD